MAGLWDFLRSLAGGDGAPPPPPQASGGIRADPSRSARMDEYVLARLGPGAPGVSLAIVKDSAVVHAAGYGLADLYAQEQVTAGTVFHLASAGKQFTGLGILMLAEEGRLDFDDPVGRHLPEVAGFGAGVTLRQLLHHTSGIRDLYDESGTEEVLSRCQRPVNDDVLRTYADLRCPPASRGIKPGDRFAYSNSGYDLLGSVIERVSGQSYRDFFQTRVFDRLDMKDTFTFPDRRLNTRRRAAGYYDDGGDFAASEGTDLDDIVGSGSFYTTVTDLCLYDRALATHSLVSEASMRLALTSGRTNDGEETGYGFGWYVGTYEGMPFCDHDGDWNGNYSYICRYLDRSLSIFTMSNNPNLNLVEIANLATAVYR